MSIFFRQFERGHAILTFVILLSSLTSGEERTSKSHPGNSFVTATAKATVRAEREAINEYNQTTKRHRVNFLAKFGYGWKDGRLYALNPLLGVRGI